jgi:hypothetical protein
MGGKQFFASQKFTFFDKNCLFTGLGFFPIERATLLAMFSTTVTYFIIMAQS